MDGMEGLGYLGGMIGFTGGMFTNKDGSNMIISGISLIVVTWFLNHMKTFLQLLLTSLASRTYYSVKISSPDTIYFEFLDYISTKKTWGTRGLNAQNRYNFQQGSQNARFNNQTPQSISFQLTPTGTQYFFYKFYLVSMTRNASEKSQSMPNIQVRAESIDINVYGGNMTVINDLLSDANKKASQKGKDRTSIYAISPAHRGWEIISNQMGRPLNSVILEQDQKDKLVNDFQSFFDDAKWYQDTGVPYRRGYIFHGPPGCGKTSFILAMAHRFEKNICVLNMSKDVDDSNITQFVQKAPQGCILVMEDVDAAFQQTREKTLTLSGLLNAIDGLASSDGRILIMTTNHIEKLQSSLIRPGRIDIKVKFDLATHYQIKTMFLRFFEEKYHNLIPDILAIVPPKSVGLSQVQGWFIVHRNSPLGLCDTIKQFYIEKEENEKIQELEKQKEKQKEEQKEVISSSDEEETSNIVLKDINSKSTNSITTNDISTRKRNVPNVNKNK